jgi:hypothetical protein
MTRRARREHEAWWRYEKRIKAAWRMSLENLPRLALDTERQIHHAMGWIIYDAIETLMDDIYWEEIARRANAGECDIDRIGL